MLLIQVLVVFIVALIMLLNRVQRRYVLEHGKLMDAQIRVRALLRAIHGTDPFFACPACGAVSYSLADLEHGWCGRCHAETHTPYQLAVMDAEIS